MDDQEPEHAPALGFHHRGLFGWCRARDCVRDKRQGTAKRGRAGKLLHAKFMFHSDVLASQRDNFTNAQVSAGRDGHAGSDT